MVVSVIVETALVYECIKYRLPDWRRDRLQAVDRPTHGLVALR
jgi:hypothetical protein